MQRIKQYRILAWVFAIIFFVANALLIVVTVIAPKNEQGEITDEWAQSVLFLLLIGLLSFILFIVFAISIHFQKKALIKNAAPVVPINPNDKLCTYCGAVISSDYKFCLNCGKQVINQEPVISLLDGGNAQKEEVKDDVPTYESSKPAKLSEYYKAMFYGCASSYVALIFASVIIAAFGIYDLVSGYIMGNSIGSLVFSIAMLFLAIMFPLLAFVIIPLSKINNAKKFNKRETIKVYDGLICIESYVYNEGSAGASRMKIFLESVRKAKEDDKGYYFSFTNENIQKVGLFILKEPDMSDSFKAGLSNFVNKVIEKQEKQQK